MAALILAIFFFMRARSVSSQMENIAGDHRAKRLANDALAESRAPALAAPVQAVPYLGHAEDSPQATKTQNIVNQPGAPVESIANDQTANLGEPIQELPEHSGSRPAHSDRTVGRNRLDRLIQGILIIVSSIMIWAGASGSDKIEVGSLWGGIGWALVIGTFVIFIAQLFGVRPLVRHAHAAILIPLFVIALGMVAVNEPEPPRSTALVVLGFMISCFGIIALGRGAFVLVRRLRR